MSECDTCGGSGWFWWPTAMVHVACADCNDDATKPIPRGPVQVPRPVTLLALLLAALLMGGCPAAGALAVAALGIDAASNAFAITQRLKARQSQDEQTAEIKALREEIAAHRLRPNASYICRHETLVYDARGKSWNATICSPVE